MQNRTPLRCSFGFHPWSTWSTPLRDVSEEETKEHLETVLRQSEYTWVPESYQRRCCLGCNKVQQRLVGNTLPGDLDE